MGKNLTQTLIEATDLPQDTIQNEFNGLLHRHGLNPDTLSMDELREVMADYLHMVFQELISKDDLSA